MYSDSLAMHIITVHSDAQILGFDMSNWTSQEAKIHDKYNTTVASSRTDPGKSRYSLQAL